MTFNMQQSETGLQTAKSPVIKVIGVGGAGGNIVSQFAHRPLANVTSYVLNTDAAAMHQGGAAQAISLGRAVTLGLSAGGDPKIGRAAAESDVAQLQEVCKGASLVFVVAGMGGGTGSGAAPVVARVAREAGALVLGIVTMPFDFEGSRRQRQAALGLARLRAEADAVIRMPNQSILKKLDPQGTIVELFQAANAAVADGIHGIWKMLNLQGLINLDFASLRSAVAGRNAESLLWSAEASGDNRAFEIWAKIEATPHFDAQLLSDAESVLVNVVAGEDLIRAESEWIMSQVNHIGTNADIRMGAVIDPAFQGRMEVTIIATRFGRADEQGLAESDRTDAASAPVAKAPETIPDMTPQNLLQTTTRSRSQCVPPAPTLGIEKTQQIYRRQSGKNRRKKDTGMQGMLPLQIVAKNRFEKCTDNIHDGENLDIPTYLRRGVTLN